MKLEPEVVIDAGATVGEGPLWDHRSVLLSWIDIGGRHCYTYEPRSGKSRKRAVNEEMGCVGLANDGRPVAGTRSGIGLFDPDRGSIELMAWPEWDKPGNRFNGGKVAPGGSFHAGTRAFDNSRGAGTLNRCSGSFAVRILITDLTISNGLDWSPEGSTLYFIDSGEQAVWAFDVDAKSGRIELPASRVTCCAFGGEDLGTLSITTANYALSEAERASRPLAGALSSCTPGVAGRVSNTFAVGR